MPKVVAKRGSTVEAKIPLVLQEGYHVNSNTPSESYLIPLSIKWSPGALEAAGMTFPKPRLEKYEFSEKPLSVFTGKFDVVTKFKVPANAPIGPGAAVGRLRYQACNNKACFPPKNVEVTVPFQIQ